jgi:hypothetical protein
MGLPGTAAQQGEIHDEMRGGVHRPLEARRVGA